MKKAYSYLRFSTPDQMKGDSYRRQVELSVQYANRHDLELDEYLKFQDLGVSAFRGKNKNAALGTFFEAVDNGQIAQGSYLLVESLDRLSRESVHNAFTQFSSILQSGINIVTLTDNKLYTKESINESFGDLLISLSIMFRAHEESLTKSKRLKAAWENKRKLAGENGKLLTRICPAWMVLDEEAQKFILIPERAEVVRRIFDLAISGFGKGSIAKTFNQEQVPTFGRAEGWHSSYVQKILGNVATVGRYQPMRRTEVNGHRQRAPVGEVIEGYFPTVIDEKIFLKAAEMRKSRKISVGRQGQRHSNILSGLCVCGECGGSMNYVNKGSGDVYLVCSNRIRKVNDCQNKSWRYFNSQAFIMNGVKELDFGVLLPEAHSSLIKAIMLLEDTILVKRKKLKEAQEKLDAVLDLLLDRSDSKTLKAKFDALESTVGQLNIELPALEDTLRLRKEKSYSLERSVKDNSTSLRKWAEMQLISIAESDEKATLERSQLNQLLKKTFETITFSLSGEEGTFGVIDVKFKDAENVHRLIRVDSEMMNAASGLIVNGEQQDLFGLRVDPDQVRLIKQFMSGNGPV